MGAHTDHYAERDSPQGDLGTKGETMSPVVSSEGQFEEMTPG